jgi:hypothetical protein
MLSLVALILVLVATTAFALPAESHEWYAGLRSPSGMPCCNERDCHPSRPVSTATPGAKRFRRTERGTRSSTARCCPSPPPMAAIMPVGATRRDDLTFAAASFPASPPSPRPRVQLESLLAFLFRPKRGRRRTCRSLSGWRPGSEHFNNPKRFDGMTQPHAHVGEHGVQRSIGGAGRSHPGGSATGSPPCAQFSEGE